MSFMEERIKEEINNALAEIDAISELMVDEAISQKDNPTIKNLMEPGFSPKINRRLLLAGFKINLLKALS